MTKDHYTPRTEAARFEALRDSAFRWDCIPLKLGQELERELTESQAQSHGLARRVVEAEMKLEIAENDAKKYKDKSKTWHSHYKYERTQLQKWKESWLDLDEERNKLKSDVKGLRGLLHIQGWTKYHIDKHLKVISDDRNEP